LILPNLYGLTILDQSILNLLYMHARDKFVSLLCVCLRRLENLDSRGIKVANDFPQVFLLP